MFWDDIVFKHEEQLDSIPENSKDDNAYLVTGNIKHFPKKPFIVTPVEMLAIINEMETIEHRVLSEPATGYGKW